MNQNEFLTELKEMMMLSEDLNKSDRLIDIEAFDSMTHLILLSLYEEKFNIKLESEDLINAETVCDLLKLAGLSD